MKQRLQDDLKTAMKAKDKVALDCLRMVIAQIKKDEIDAGKESDEAAVIKAIKKGMKTRQDSVEAYAKAGRNELAEKEKKEIEILSKYVPAQMSDAQVEEIVVKQIAELGASSKAQMGQVMKAAMAALGGGADGKRVSRIVASKLK